MSRQRSDLYVYGVTDANGELKPALVGIGGRVTFIPYRDIAFAVSSVSFFDIHDHTSEHTVLRYAGEHERVVRRLLDRGPVVPMSFGAVAGSEEEARQVLSRSYLQLKTALEFARDRVELRLKVAWNEAAVLQDIAGSDTEVMRLREAIEQKAGDEEAARLRVEAGKRVFELVQQRRREYEEEIIQTVRPLTVEIRRLPPRAAVPGGANNVLLSVALLVEKSRLAELERDVQNLGGRHLGEFGIQSAGPLPLYDFVDLRFGVSDVGMLKAARDTLGLGETASLAEVKHAYLTLAATCHPDVNPADSELEGKFREINQAYRLLLTYCEHYACSFRPRNVRRTLIIESRELASHFEDRAKARIG